MRLASIGQGDSGARLVVVSSDLTEMTDAGLSASSLATPPEDWSRMARPLADLSDGVEQRAVPLERFHERTALSPLPKDAHRLIVSSSVDGVASPQIRPADFHPPREVVQLGGGAGTVELDVSIAVLLDAVEHEADAESASHAIRVVALVADFAGEGGRAVSLVSPVAVTLETMEAASARLPLSIDANGQALLRADATPIGRDLAALVVRAASQDSIAGGTVLTTSLAKAQLSLGDTVRLEVRDAGGHSLFGAIETRLARPS